MMLKFEPRQITEDMAAQGFNNAGRGELIGYVAIPAEHETTCAYRKNPTRTPVPGEPNAHTGVQCNCRIGLWREQMEATKLIAKVRKPRERKG